MPTWISKPNVNIQYIIQYNIMCAGQGWVMLSPVISHSITYRFICWLVYDCIFRLRLSLSCALYLFCSQHYIQYIYIWLYVLVEVEHGSLPCHFHRFRLSVALSVIVITLAAKEHSCFPSYSHPCSIIFQNEVVCYGDILYRETPNRISI